MKERKHKPSFNNGVRVGRNVVIRREPPRAKRTGFLFGTVHEIVEPPKGYLNTLMAVWLEDSQGNARCLSFPYWMIIPKDTEFDEKAYKQKHTQQEQTTKYVPTIMPVQVEEEHLVRRRKKEPELAQIRRRR